MVSIECMVGGVRFAAVPADAWRATGNVASAAGSLTLKDRNFILLPCDEQVGATEQHGPSAELAKLTGRELQIALRIGGGSCDKTIAHDLGISEYTVREHVRRIFHKWGVSKRAAIVRIVYTGRPIAAAD